MSEVQNTPAPVAEPIAEPTTAATTTTEQPDVSATESAAPVAEPEVPAKPVEEAAAAPAPFEEKKDEVTAPTTTKAADKVVEPITEGQLAVKGPGFIK